MKILLRNNGRLNRPCEVEKRIVVPDASFRLRSVKLRMVVEDPCVVLQSQIAISAARRRI